MCHAHHTHHAHSDVQTHTHTAPGLFPVLDIGGEVGALVVYLADQTATGELEACPTSDPDHRFHTGVHSRSFGEAAAWVAIFPEVVEGTYHLLDDAGSPMATVAVTGGNVEQLDLRQTVPHGV
jgi:hypothetical protein